MAIYIPGESINNSDNGVVFFHNPKTAGMSMRHALSSIPGSIKIVGGRMRSGHLYPCQFENAVQHKKIYKTRKNWTFSFVRNPWDWFVSLYAFVLSKPRHRLHSLAYTGGFEMLIERVIKHESWKQEKYAEVDYVGQFEFLDRDWAVVCNHLGRELTLEKRNTSKHTPYQEYYNEETQKIVSVYNSKLIERFDYTFE